MVVENRVVMKEDESGQTTVFLNEEGEEVLVICETDTHRILVWKKE